MGYLGTHQSIAHTRPGTALGPESASFVTWRLGDKGSKDQRKSDTTVDKTVIQPWITLFCDKMAAVIVFAIPINEHVTKEKVYYVILKDMICLLFCHVNNILQ